MEVIGGKLSEYLLIKREDEVSGNNIFGIDNENHEDEKIKKTNQDHNETRQDQRETEKDLKGIDPTTTENVQETPFLNYVNDDFLPKKKNCQKTRVNNNLRKETVKIKPRIKLNKKSPHLTKKKFKNPPCPDVNETSEPITHSTEYSVFIKLDGKTYCCNHCKALTTNKRQILRHIRLIHRNKALFLNKQKKLKKLAQNVTSSYVAWYEYKSEDGVRQRCSHCHKFFKDLLQVESHIRKEHRILPIGSLKWKQCPHCPFQTLHSLKCHLLHSHTDEKDIEYFRCAICDYKTKARDKLKPHMLSMHIDELGWRSMMHKCQECPKIFKTISSLTHHMKGMHGSEQKMKCFHCSYECKRKTSMTLHLQTYHMRPEELETLSCQQCPFKTKYPHLMGKHIVRQHRRVLQCHICSYQSGVKAIMDLHLIGHQKEKNEKDWKFRCDKCDYRTYRQYSFNIHKLNHLKPEEIQYFYCYHCEFKAKRKDNLKTHVLRHFKKNEVTFACYLCDFTTQRRSVLGKHLNGHSTAGNNMKELTDEDGLVPVDNKPSKNSRVNTKSKEEEVKGDEDTFACYLCDFTTIKQHLLVRHIDKHSKEENMVKKLKPKVSRSLPVKNTLKNERVDMKSENGDARQGEETLVCYHCDFITSKRYVLVRHMGKHRKEANYEKCKPGS